MECPNWSVCSNSPTICYTAADWHSIVASRARRRYFSTITEKSGEARAVSLFELRFAYAYASKS